MRKLKLTVAMTEPQMMALLVAGASLGAQLARAKARHERGEKESGEEASETGLRLHVLSQAVAEIADEFPASIRDMETVAELHLKELRGGTANE